MTSETGKVAVIGPHLDATEDEMEVLIAALHSAGFTTSRKESTSPFTIGEEYWVVREGTALE